MNAIAAVLGIALLGAAAYAAGIGFRREPLL